MADTSSHSSESVDGDELSELDALITDIATDLMGVPRSEAMAAMNGVLDHLVEFFAVDDTFLRKHRPDRISELVTIRPEREIVAEDDSIREMAFDDDPVFGLVEHLKEPFVLYPEGSEQIQELVRANLGVDRCSFAVVPLLRDNHTVGIMGLVRFTDQKWLDNEVRTLFAIATLMAQFWSRLEVEEQLAYQAHYDELTGLPNRFKMVEEVGASTDHDCQSLLMINIDNMKAINDGLDYDLGDRFLVGFASQLSERIRDDAVAARVSGDQFAVLVRDCDRAGAERLAARLVDDLRQSVDLGDVKIARSVSIGVAHRDLADEERDLFVEADAALHLAKKEGKNSYRVFDRDMRMKVIEKFEQEIELRRAIENQEFLLHYQPALNLRERSVFAVEALVRWNHPSGKLLSAGVFVETAEESGLVVEIGDFVLAEAISQMSRWQKRYPGLEMWINISPAQLMSRDLPTQIAGLLEQYSVDASRLCLEVTEHVMLEDLQTVTGALDRIRAMGVRLALDDFGTGYSSMKQLKDLPFDCLKIDMSFVAGLGKSEHDAAIVDAAITLANAFGLETVAEGVETDQQVDELLSRGCDQAQGFLLAMPQGPDDIEVLLASDLQTT